MSAAGAGDIERRRKEERTNLLITGIAACPLGQRLSDEYFGIVVCIETMQTIETTNLFDLLTSAQPASNMP